MEYSLSPLGDGSIVLQSGKTIDIDNHRKIQAIKDYLKKHPFPGMLEYIPAYTTLTIFYDVMGVESYKSEHGLTGTTPYQLVCEWIEHAISEMPDKANTSTRLIKIPVCYGSDDGPDLKIVAEHNGLTEREVIDIHSEPDYLVYMIGFAPGFPYIGGMSEKIETPRKESPRVEIPARTVGIAGMETGVYPIETPGGWQLIGKTPVELFRPDNPSPTLLESGDMIRFYPISEEEYLNWEVGSHDDENT